MRNFNFVWSIKRSHASNGIQIKFKFSK